MPEYCKHGVDMAQTCGRCGRMKVTGASDFAAKKERFLNSIDRLEATVRRMQEDLAKGPRELEPRGDPEQPEAEPPTPPTPPQRFPWQRS